jgi:1,4-dihydroxy-2-naphthoate octaprenyltransferase
LLLLNQFPDLEADQNAGRYHFPILIGRKKISLDLCRFFSNRLYAVVYLCLLFFFTDIQFIGLLSLTLAIPAARISLQYTDDMERLKPALALNVAVTLSTPVLVAAGIIWQHILSFD